MRNKRLVGYLDKVANSIEVLVALVLLVIIVLKFLEMLLMQFGVPSFVHVDFEQVMSQSFALVIGVEFAKMLYKHTPETIIDVLLFATARTTVLYHDTKMDIVLGVVAIAALFAVRSYLCGNKHDRNTRTDSED